MDTYVTTSEQLCIRTLQGVGAILVACLLVLAVPTPMQPDFDGRGPRYSKRELLRTIHWYARQYRLDPALLRAVVKAESDFDPRAVSRKGAAGLMQLMPHTAAHHRVADPFDPIQNIRAGARQLRRLVNRYDGNLPLALAAYNAGARRVKDNKVPRIRETRAYVHKVLRFYRDFKAKDQPQKAKPPGAHYRSAPPIRPSPSAAAPLPKRKKGADSQPDRYADPPQAHTSF
ncbi:MAG: lytic transglycosylase domain-containing protein [Nitrospiraceae bacterium]